MEDVGEKYYDMEPGEILYDSSSDSSGSEYDPEEDENLSDFEEEFELPDEPILGRERVIVEKDLLRKLLGVCNHPNCGSAVDDGDIEEYTVGAAVCYKVTCANNHEFKWETSAKIGKDPNGKSQLFTINVYLATLVLVCGLNISQVAEYFFHLSLECIEESFFFRLQSRLLHRVIWYLWTFSQNKEIERLKLLKSEGNKIALGGDGKFDSPGFSAAYCTYSVQSLDTKKIIAFFVAAKHVVNCSSAMEPYAAKTILRFLVFEHKLMIDSFTTDRSRTMKAMLSEFNEELPDSHTKIQHLYDIWHWVKSVIKDLWEASKLKSCEALGDWIPSIKNQLWWAFGNSIGNLELLTERIYSIPGHLTNTHTFPTHKQHKECAHGPLGERAWLEPDSKAISKVKAALNGYKDCRKDDLEMMIDFTHTGDLECFNALLNKYCPKRFYYRHMTMLSRTACAALDHNFNTDRQQAKTSKGVLKFDIVRQRHGKKYYAKPVKEDKNHSWREIILRMVVKCIETSTRPDVTLPVLDDVESVRPRIDKPEKSAAIEAHKSRLLLNANVV